MDDTHPLDHDAIADEAALWYARLDNGTADEAAFEAWRERSPHHAAAFARIAATDLALDRVNGLALENDPDLKPVRGLSRRDVMGVAAATLVALVVGGFWLTSARRASASTQVGGRRTVTLPDGGRIDLNTNTRVSWKFDGSRRRIWLERGEANVVVPSDSRPCTVMAGDTRIVLNAGNLNARLTGDKVTLAVLKGDCTVSSDGAGRGPVSHLSANESVVTGAGATHVQPLTDDEAQSLLAWRQDALVFHGETLQAAVDEYNRYLTTRMVIIDPSIADIRLGGRFKTNDPEAFLSALHSSFDIQANTSSSGAIVLSR